MTSNANDTTLFPAGTFNARPVDWMLTATKGGAEQYAVELEITSQGEGIAGQRLTWFGSFASDKATEITVKALRTLGWQGNDLDAVELATEQDVRIVVEHEEYEGRVHARVRWINALGGLAVRAPLDEGRRRSFAEKMKGAIAAIDARNATAPRTPAQQPQRAPAAPPPRSPAPRTGNGSARKAEPWESDPGTGAPQAGFDDVPF